MFRFAFFIAVLSCTAKANEDEISPNDKTVSHLDTNPRPDTNESLSQASALPACCGLDEIKHSLAHLIQEEQESRGWYSEMVKVLNQLVQENKEEGNSHAEVLNVLRVIKDQEEQQLQHLQSMARLQSLLIENHQALLLQVSRIATMLHDADNRQSK
ncbi:hypothetical protein E1301_Tti020389 [Triplophysa tibetana]|uniref:Uncharacterized protein n=1 Tax=Triplophysa tibetana TaxID=1572043 RepID=A0A5A9PEY8_9TELE|nr:hypothetical protein E1301_Tti020389 [Triplophysa tibetana]